jgi:hypothetical protein
LSTLEEAIVAMGQEETRLKQIKTLEVVPKPAYYVATRDCHNCGIKGHLSHNCFAPKSGSGSGRGYGWGNYKGVRGRNAGYSNYHGNARANMSAMDEGQGQPSSGQSEAKMGEQQTNVNFGDFAHFV